jgi:hypothetical protein
MNEKIRALAEQSGFFPVPDETEWDWEYRAENARYEKFAELIVKEILNISDEVITLSDSPEWLICEKLGVNHDWRRQDNFWS